jgi:DNA-binding NarL/FixJ family response regulator
MKVLLVDDHILFREGLSSLLVRLPDIHIIGTAETVSGAVEKARNLRPDLILMNFNLSDGNGLEATHAILAECPETNIVFLTTHNEDERLFEAIRYGAVGYLNKGISLKKFLAYIRSLKVDSDTTLEPIMVN